MCYFIDTNIFIFLCSEDHDELTPDVRDLFDDYGNMFIMSSESLQEIALLLKKGKIGLKNWKSYQDVMDSVENNNIAIRYVDKAHMKTLYKLDLIPDHSDPADLMIISQAIAENIDLISSDREFKDYMPQGLKLIPNYR